MDGAPGSGPRPARGRLSRSADFDRVFRQGRSRAGRELVLYVFPRGSRDGGRRLGLSVSRKVGGAVQRNRVKRLLREAFAQEGERLAQDADAVVVARRGARELAERAGLAGIRAALAELIDGFAPAADAGDGPEPALEPGRGREPGLEVDRGGEVAAGEHAGGSDDAGGADPPRGAGRSEGSPSGEVGGTGQTGEVLRFPAADRSRAGEAAWPEALARERGSVG